MKLETYVRKTFFELKVSIFLIKTLSLNQKLLALCFIYSVEFQIDIFMIRIFEPRESLSIFIKNVPLI